MRKLYEYPILHIFLAELYERCEIYITDDIFTFIKDDDVSEYCRCHDSGCSTVYLRSERLPVLDGDDEYIETYNSDKGLIILHFYTNGNIEIEALEYDDYPFRDEVKALFNQENDYALESDLEVELQKQLLRDAKRVVEAYFDTKQIQLNTIIVDKTRYVLKYMYLK